VTDHAFNAATLSGPHAPAALHTLADRRTGAARRQRLLFLVTQFETGGAQAQALLRLSHLDPSRYDVTLCVLTSVSGYLLDRVKANGIRVIRAGLDLTPTLYSKLRRLQAIIDAERPDVVTGFLYKDHTYGMLASVLSDVPLVVADMQNEWICQRSYPLGIRVSQIVCLGLCADVIVGCSARVRDSYVRAWPWIGGRTRAILNSIDPAEAPAERDAASADPATVRIGTLGRFQAQKHHDLLLRAAARVVARHPQARFVITGDGPLRAALEQRVRALGLEQHVELPGETKTPYEFLNSLDVFALSSLWEGLPVVAMEAMACGVPVVSTRVGGVAEIVDETTGVLCPPDDERALADAITQLIEDPARRRALGEASRTRARERFDVRGAVRQWEDIYRTAPARHIEDDDPPAAVRVDDAPNGLVPNMTVSRILLLRTCPQPRALRIAAELRNVYPNARLDVLGQDQWREAIGTALPDARYIPYGNGPLTLRKLGWRRLNALHRAGYDLVVLPYNLASETGYRHAELVALVAGGGSVLCYAAWTDDVYPLPLRTWSSFPRQAFGRTLFMVPAAGLVLRALGKGIWRRLVTRRPARWDLA
jgi:glycosyltransferase involved in cell wall biosynthesis